MVTPVLYSPGNGAAGLDLFQPLSWEVISEPGEARVQVSTREDFRDTSLDLITSDPSVDLQALIPTEGYVLTWNTTFWWRVAYKVTGEAWGPWSTPFRFTTATKDVQFDLVRHREAAQSLLLSQFSEVVAPKLNAIVRAIGRQCQDLENALVDLLVSRMLPYAAKAQLDIIGTLVGEPRNSLDDDVYRVAIQLRIYRNNCGGTPAEMAAIARQLSGAAAVQYIEIGPAQYRLVLGIPVPTGLLETMQSLSPGGVRLLGIHETWPLVPMRVGDRVGESLYHE